MSSSNQSKKLQYVQAGACIRDNGVIDDCQLTAEKCKTYSNADTYMSPHQIIALNDPLAFENSCLKQDEVQMVNVGVCLKGSDRNQCTSTAFGCENPDSFLDGHGQCIVRGDRFDVGETTVFPLCVFANEESVCVFDETLCPTQANSNLSGEELAMDLLSPLEVEALGLPPCLCDRVQTGACMDSSGLLICAISSDACDPISTWIPRHRVQDEYNVDCRLCTPLPKKETQTTVSSGSSASTDKAVLIGIIAGVIVGLAIVGAISAVVVMRRRRRAKRAQDQVKAELPSVASSQMEMESVSEPGTDSSEVL